VIVSDPLRPSAEHVTDRDVLVAAVPLTPDRKRALVKQLEFSDAVSQRRACQTLTVARSTVRYQSIAEDQAALRIRLRDLAAARVRYGYRRLHTWLLREGRPVNHKPVHRVIQ
jgi:putative transposase